MKALATPPCDDTPPVSDMVPVTLREKIAYGCGDLSSNLMWGMTASYLLYYYTDIYRLPLADVGWILLVARIFDSICDPLAGYLIDRRGGGIISIFIGKLSVPFGISAFMCFLPLPFSDTGKVIWACLSYIIFGAVYSGINTSYGTLGNLMTTRADERIGLNAFRMMGCYAGQFIIALLTIPAINFLGGGSDPTQQRTGITIYVLLLAILGSLLWRMVYRGCIIRNPLPGRRTSLPELLSGLMRNGLWHISNAVVFLQFLCIAATSGFAVYYARIVLHGSATLGGMLLTLATVCWFIGALLTPVACRWRGYQHAFVGAVIVQATCEICIGNSVGGTWGIIFTFALFSIVTGLASPLYYVLLADAIEHGHIRHGKSMAGMAYALNTLVSKVSMAIGGFILVWFLRMGHYTPTGNADNPDIAFWIRMGFVWLPAVALVGQGIILYGLLHKTRDRSLA
ncbi:MFS transporter [Komagataeibacter sp. FXV3]|uniref:MFS transporter n=1 Tax=Komagataeibacter sp. FXV3 TaxID=2608998 RepID=UPI00187B5151|nr:glycoside-pentoside-hexuronide (GPH):cation symporter [Komagataeibacter sp. FXV3]MBE7728300.1 MFS transporter [Komagataeibacter sp. FXV3]